MKLDEADLEQSFFEPVGKSVDKSVTYILLGLFAVFFFLIMLFGIQRVQKVTVEPTNERTQLENDPSLEISGTAESAKK